MRQPAAASLLIVVTIACGGYAVPQVRGTGELPPNVSRPERLHGRVRNPRIVVSKARRLLELYSGEQLLRSYRIGLGFSPEGDKEVEGDGRTPEGEFYVFVKNPRSSFYLSLGVSYPAPDDAERGLRAGLISRAQHDAIVAAHRARRTPPQTTRLGGQIFIHGNGASSDWTLGCVALEDEDMKELYDAVGTGAPVTILP